MAQQHDTAAAALERITTAVIAIVNDLATDIGRLRRRAEPGSSLDHLTSRLTSRIETLDAIVHPTGHDLYTDFFTICGDHNLACHEALLARDTRTLQLRARLGLTPDGHRPHLELAPSTTAEAA